MLKNGKWARKYDKCIKCWEIDFKHHWKWICTCCYDKKRSKTTARKIKTAEYKKKYAVNHPEIVEKCKEWWKEWARWLNEVFVILNKGRRWKKEWKICIEYKWKPIPLYITSRDPEIQRKWQAVKHYIDNRTRPWKKL